VPPDTGGTVPLARALSKLGAASRAEAHRAIADGRVRVNGRVVRRHDERVSPERDRIEVDGSRARRAPWRAVLLHKPRGVITTRRDPQGRRTVFDLLPADALRLVVVGRLDLATTGVLLLTSDTRLADWLTDPRHAVERTYRVTVRGRLETDAARRLQAGVVDRGDRLRAERVGVRKASARESHAIVVLTEGRNREVRRLFEAVGHEVTALARVQFGGLQLGSLAPGTWREIGRDEMRAAFPEAPLAD
jgi:23S rRNA pseudouridine2605 synthase